jgi:hypothetical protein
MRPPFSKNRFKLMSGVLSGLAVTAVFLTWSPSAQSSDPPASPTPAPAQSCQDFSLTDKGQSMEKIPVRDQGNVGICYAYASAEAIDAWRLSNDAANTHFLTSPHAVAVSAKFNVSQADKTVEVFEAKMHNETAVVDGQDITETVRAVKKDGICSYDAFGSNFKQPDNRYNTNPLSFWLDVNDDYKSLHSAYMEALINHDSSAENKTVARAADRLSDLLCNAGFSEEQSKFTKLADVTSIIGAEDVFSALKVLANKVCAGHTEPLPSDFPNPVTYSNDQLPPGMSTDTARAKVYGKMIDAMFNFKNKQPIMIGYCAEVLGDFGNVGIDPKTGDVKKGCGLHASLIVGRGTLPDGRCGFLIRNSWGTDRDDAHGVTSQIDDQSDIMIPEDALYNNLTDIAVLPPRGEKYQPPQNTYQGIVVPSPKKKDSDDDDDDDDSSAHHKKAGQ